MSRQYEATIVLDTKGKEDSVETLVSQVSRSFEENGAKLSQVDNLGKKKFPYSPRNVESGYFVTFLFDAEPTALDKIQAKLKLNENVYQQYFQRR
jgi:small subunit ribosomal protein S6